MTKFELIVTVGPAILQVSGKLKEIDCLGPCIYRLNGAHINPDDLGLVADQIRKILPSARLMIDLPGNKIRTANLLDPLRLVKGEVVRLFANQVNLATFYQYVRPGDMVLANDSLFTLEVLKVEGTTLQLLSHSDGLLLSNKGLHVRGIHQSIPFLFEKDSRLIEEAIAAGLDFVSLSFVRRAADVMQARAMLGDAPIKVISKIETCSALDHLDEIMECVDILNVDRGDLSTETGFLELAKAVDDVVKKGQAAKKTVFLATQFLKNMETNPVPLLSELSDLYRTIRIGVHGIQLSEETAVGRYPVECVKLAFDMAKGLSR
jgi:pyruvate kinase